MLRGVDIVMMEVEAEGAESESVIVIVEQSVVIGVEPMEDAMVRFSLSCASI